MTDIGWRCTTFRALANNMIIVPNAKLSQAIVTNYYLPDKRIGVSFQVTVSYDCDFERVEETLGEVLRQAVAEIPGLLAEPAPNVTFEPGFAESGLGLTVNYQVAEFASQFTVRNELRKRIFLRFRELGLTVPYPTRTVYLRGGGRRGGNTNSVQPGPEAAHQ